MIDTPGIDALERGTTGRRDPAPPEIVLIPAATITPKSVRWALQDRIPLEMVSFLVGPPGAGKSTVLLDLSARLSTGTLAGDLWGTPIAVAIATAEDALAQVVAPRLLAAGADCQRVHVLRVRRDGVLGGMVLPEDLDALRPQMIAHDVRLLVVDPLVAHLPGALDAHRDQHVRRALAPLTQFAEETGAAVAAVLHLSKRETTDVLTKIGGSVGFGAACRSVLLLAADPEDPEGPTRILAHGKCNVGALAPSLRLRVESREVASAGGDRVRTSAIAWCGEAAGVLASDLIGTDPAEKDAVGEAMDFIRDLLANGPLPSKDVLHALKQNRVPERAWKRAKRRLGVTRCKAGFTGGWEWRLPTQGAEEGRLTENVLLRDEGGVKAKQNQGVPTQIEGGHLGCPSSDGTGASSFGAEDPAAVARELFGGRLLPRDPGEEG